MPEISRFYGIVIKMYWDDHWPPHFHAEHGDDQAQIRIEPVGVLRGKLPPRALGKVAEWAALHRDELMMNWELALHRQPLNKIEGLP
jgi:hypothetical protein